MLAYPILPAQRLTGTVRIAHLALPKSVTMESPALEIMTDLRHTHVAEIEPHATMELANIYMMQRSVRSLFVLNDDHLLQGVITASDILGDKPVRFIQERRVKYGEILVSDIMTPLDCLEAIPIEEVQYAKVGHVIASLRDAGRQHTLVIEEDAEGAPLVCGIFSLTQIEKQLGTAILLTEVAKTFAEIEATLMH
ncbi:CBS domain-containing protein [Nitrosomonas sp. Nm58]|uniref:CBS domain-containing protein n=1 Tax=Nitrosomonas sp. Nm58 TaxID=200126 RepID=UPI00089D57A5|nr:CBS domain-containing protein [Nitrosomonas sp. Nm58]SDY91174.1 CBS domain-containing protein [Nitrosomonas sp. Nm58]